MKKFKIELTEEELRAVIMHHIGETNRYEIDPDRTKRINDLTKRLKNDGPEISNDPRPKNEPLYEGTAQNNGETW